MLGDAKVNHPLTRRCTRPAGPVKLQSVALVVFVAVQSAYVRRDGMLSIDNNANGARWTSRTTRMTGVTRRRSKEEEDLSS